MGVLDLVRYEEVKEYLLKRREQLEKDAVSGEDGLVSFFPGRFWPVLGDLSTAVENSLDDCGVESLNPMIDDLMWSRILKTPYCKGANVEIYDRKGLPPFPNRNTAWDGTLKGLNRVGRPGGEGEFLRPSGEYITDLTAIRGGDSVLNAAHDLAHTRSLMSDDGKKMPLRFLETLAEICMASRYSDSIDMWVPAPGDIAYRNRPDDRSWFRRNHVKVVVSTNIRKPWVEVPVAELLRERTQVVVLAGIHLEPQPWSTREGNPDSEDESWLEMNRWSCMPSIICLSGWIGVDELMKGPLVVPYRNAGKEDVCVTAPVTALHPMGIFDGLVLMSDRNGINAPGAIDISRLLHMKLAGSGCVPPLPCKECMKLNMAANGAPTRPAVKRPPERKDRRKSDKLDEAEQVWAEYDAKVEKIYRVVDKAREFWDVRFGNGLKDRKERRRNARKVADLQAKMKSCQSRVDRYEKNMEYTKAEFEREALSELRKELRELLETP